MGLHRKLDNNNLIVKVLEEKGQTTRSELVSRTGLSRRCINYELRVMVENGMLQRRINLADLREVIYEYRR